MTQGTMEGHNTRNAGNRSQDRNEHMKRRKGTAGGRRRHETKDRPPTFRGWISTDEDEVKRREWRGRTEIDEVRVLDREHGPFADYRVASASGSAYVVEVRSLRERINSCECRDYRTNRLGTCKHIEGVRRHPGGTRSFRATKRDSSERIEVFLDERDGPVVRVMVPETVADGHPGLVQEAEQRLRGLRRGSGKALAALRALALDRPDLIRVSRRLDGWAETRRAAIRRHRERARFAADLEAGRRSLDFLKRPLLPYQTEGVLHLAFGERALLADDMGLGKTVQAIAASALLRDLRGVERVLVVSPASLKAEWEEQIAIFSDFPSTVVLGSPQARRAAYARHTFFTLCNYEQIVTDRRELLQTLRPDLVILDEAQRIKNWQTKTANAVKKLDTRYAFVLTGTPLENRIDEIYSIVQFLDPEILGPLFRFNRNFYELDERGRPIGHRNLDVLAKRVSSVMLRRRKEEVENELPGRTTKTFFVPMTEAQREAYEGYEFLARRLAAVAAKRPLTPEEFKMLQGNLACMRMICDTPYILDGRRHECPKMEEIERLLPDLMDDPERKIIIFSEWVRMLELVRDYAAEAGIEFAWHTGSVPQHRRRAEIKRFREDPDCRLFLSSESGGVGLNLQAADTVVNMDQPWNPARLEQRIARAWRKHQTRHVNVINLVSEHTIEHRMLGLLDAKRTLAEGVLDGRGDLANIPLPTSRAAFVERMQAVLGARAEGEEEADDAAGTPPPTTALDRLREYLVGEHGAALRQILVREGEDTALVVVALPAGQLAEEERRLAEATGLDVKLIDPAAHEAMLRLAEAGLISMPAGDLREVYPAPGAEGAEAASRLLRGRSLVGRAEHKLKAAALLEGGGFSEEARAPATEAARLAAGCLAALEGDPEPEDGEAAAAYLLAPELGVGELPLDAVRILSGEDVEAGVVAPVRALLDTVSRRTEGQRPSSDRPAS